MNHLLSNMILETVFKNSKDPDFFYVSTHTIYTKYDKYKLFKKKMP